MGTDVPDDSRLQEAVRYGDLQEVNEALKDGDCPNKIGLYQWSPLHEAAHIGEMEIINLLLKHSGDPNKKDVLRGCTAVYYAASQGHADCLRALLDAGGVYDITDFDGKNCLDVAIGDCIPLLRKLMKTCPRITGPQSASLESHIENGTTKTVQTQNFAFSGDKSLIQGSREDIEACVLNDTQPDSPAKCESTTKERAENTPDSDEVSLASLDSSESSFVQPSPRSPQAWSPNSVVQGVDKKLVLGHVQLSFEYNRKSAMFKVRVWEISDLLMPPAETSMISAIYVKTFLLPDKKKETKRKTEEILVGKASWENPGRELSIKDVFTPSTFKFTRAPQYKEVSPEMVAERTVHLEVCIIQKYTRRSFVLATWNMPLQMAVKRLVKGKYPLTPRISTELPENMKVYNARQLHVGLANRPYSSNPNTRAPSMASLRRLFTRHGRSSSNPDLQRVKIEKDEKAPSIEITVLNDDDIDLEDSLEQIKIMEKQSMDVWSSVPVTIPGTALNDDLHQRRSGEGHHQGNLEASCDVHKVRVLRPRREIPNTQVYYNEAFEDEARSGDCANKKKKPRGSRKFSFTGKLRDRVSTVSGSTKASSSISIGRVGKDRTERTGSISIGRVGKDRTERTESPHLDEPSWQWDNYAEPLVVAMEPISFEEDFRFDLTTPVLPMEMALDIPEVHGNSFSPRLTAANTATTGFSSSCPVLKKDTLTNPDIRVSVPPDVELHYEDDRVTFPTSARSPGRGFPSREPSVQRPKSVLRNPAKSRLSGSPKVEVVELDDLLISARRSFGNRSPGHGSTSLGTPGSDEDENVILI